MVYRSKIGPAIIIPLIVVIGSILVLDLLNHIWGGLIITAIAAIFIIYMFLTTVYTITNNQLFVHSGFLINKTIDIASIKTIAETHSPLSAPALSFDRIEIFYNTYDSVMVSPKDKAGFIAALTAINDKIEVKGLKIK